MRQAPPPGILPAAMLDGGSFSAAPSRPWRQFRQRGAGAAGAATGSGPAQSTRGWALRLCPSGRRSARNALDGSKRIAASMKTTGVLWSYPAPND